jgi:hypothetical protein
MNPLIPLYISLIFGCFGASLLMFYQAYWSYEDDGTDIPKGGNEESRIAKVVYVVSIIFLAIAGLCFMCWVFPYVIKFIKIAASFIG